MSVRLVRHNPALHSERIADVEAQTGHDHPLGISTVYDVALPHDERPWHIGLIVGPSGTGKTTILTDLFGQPDRHGWPDDRSVLDGFPAELSIREITGALNAIGFSSPPSWMRPWRTLSTGEQFRADVARSLAHAGVGGTAIIDEFTSYVDRIVARFASAAVAKYARRAGHRMVAATCHYDVIEWLQPDWLYDTSTHTFTWREIAQRPPIELRLTRARAQDVWPAFAGHHYLSSDVTRGVQCWLGEIDGRWATFLATLWHATSSRSHSGRIMRGSRLVVLPDYQGVGLGAATIETVAAVCKAGHIRFRSVGAHPAWVHHCARSPHWRMMRSASNIGREGALLHDPVWGHSVQRLTSSFEYVGRPAPIEWLDLIGPDVRATPLRDDATSLAG